MRSDRQRRLYGIRTGVSLLALGGAPSGPLSAGSALSDIVWTVGSPITPYATSGAFLNGGTRFYSLSPNSDRLPKGLSINSSTGAITGTPTQIKAKYNLIIRCTDGTTTLDSAAFETMTKSAAAATYTVTTVALWNSAMSTLADGEIVEVAAAIKLADGAINNVTGTWTTPPVIRSADLDSYIETVKIKNAVNITLEGLRISALSWDSKDATNAPIRFLAGTSSGVSIKGCLIKHGFGRTTYAPVIANGGLPVPLSTIDPTSGLPITQTNMPEFIYNEENFAVTTSSVAHAITWNAATLFASFFTVINNNSTQTIYVKLGLSGISTTAADTDAYAVAAGATILIGAGALTQGGGSTVWWDGATPKAFSDGLPTHMAVLEGAAEGVACTTRTEIGLSNWLHSGISAEGGGYPSGTFLLTSNVFEDLFDACAISSYASTNVLFDNIFRRIFRDCITGTNDTTNMAIHILGNDFVESFAPSNSAGDPHPDLTQIYTGTGTIDGFNYFGNRHIRGKTNATAAPQAQFTASVGTADFKRVQSGANVLNTSSTHGLEVSGDGIYVGYNTVSNDRDVGSDAALTIQVRPINNHAGYVFNNISGGIRSGGATTGSGAVVTGYEISGNVDVTTLAAKVAAFAAYDGSVDVENVTELETAFTPKALGPAVGLGAIGSHVDGVLIDRDATDWNNFVLWANWPTYIKFEDVGGIVSGATASTVTATEYAQVFGGPLTSQTVVPVSGTEWQSSLTDGGAAVTAWTTSSGTINQGEWIQVRKLSSATPGDSVVAGVTVNGTLFEATIITDLGALSYNIATFDSASYVRCVTPFYSGSDTKKLSWVMHVDNPNNISDYLMRIGTSSNYLSLRALSSLGLGILMADSTNATVVNLQTSVTRPASGAYTIFVSVDTTAGSERARVWFDDTDATPAPSTLTTDALINITRNTYMTIMETGQTGGVGFTWMHPEFIDFNDPAERIKFHSSNIGANGEGPLGYTPDHFITGTDAFWTSGDPSDSNGPDELGTGTRDWDLTGTVT